MAGTIHSHAVAEWVDAIWSKRTPDNPDGRIWQGFVAKHMPHGYVRFKSSPAFDFTNDTHAAFYGRVAERLKAAVLKTADLLRGPGVQIPPLSLYMGVVQWQHAGL